MPLKKTCPKCDASVVRTVKACGCGYKFTKHAKAKAKAGRKAAPGPELLDPHFAVGRTDSGGAFFFWPRKNQSLVLTRTECELMLATLAAPLAFAAAHRASATPLLPEPSDGAERVG